MLAARPDYGWLIGGNRQTIARGSCANRVFVVDPIDGTIGFLRKRPQFHHRGCRRRDAGRPVAAAIYNPITEDMFEAASWAQARDLNGEPIHVRARQADARRRAASGRTRDFMLEASNAGPNPWPSSFTAIENARLHRLSHGAAGGRKAAQFDAMISLSSKYDWGSGRRRPDRCAKRAWLRDQRICGDMLLLQQGKDATQGSVIAAGPARCMR